MRLGGRAWTWLHWIPSTVSGTLFSIIGLVTFGDLAQVQFDDKAGRPGSQLNGAMAACFMGSIITAALILMSFFVLVKKTVSQSGAGFTYGFTTAFFLLDSMLLMLAGVTLTATKHLTHQFQNSPYWSSSATHAYEATYVLAFITSVLFLITGVALISNRHSFSTGQLTVDELGLSDRLRSPSSPFSAPVTSAPAAPFPGDALPEEVRGSASLPAQPVPRYASSTAGGGATRGGVPPSRSMPSTAGAWDAA